MKKSSVFKSKIRSLSGGSDLIELPDQVEDECFITKILFYKESQILRISSYLLMIITLGISFLFSRWFLWFRIWLVFVKTNLKQADHLLITSKDGNSEIVQLKKQKLKIGEVFDEFVIFEYRLYRYYFDRQNVLFRPIKFSVSQKTSNEIHKQFGRGLSTEEEYRSLKDLYGDNSTTIPKKPLYDVLVDELMSPFFLFQIFSCLLWFFNGYNIYSAIIVFFTLTSLGDSLWEAHKNIQNLYKMSYFKINVSIYRNLPPTSQLSSIHQYRQTVCSFDLVPGDIVEIPEDNPLPADVILLNGSCIVNEAMLTGESTPIMKVSLPYNDQIFNPSKNGKSSILLSGTKCIETRFYLKGKIPVLGFVYQTGFNTLKGQLVRSILFPKGNPFNFYKDSLKFIVTLAFVALGGLAWTIYSYFLVNAKSKDILMACLDMITVVIPPALPTCMSIGIAFAISRLKKANIFCISPNKINQAGKVGIMCFDKTGTLTEEGLDMYGTLGIAIINKKPEFSGLLQVKDLVKREKKSRTMSYLLQTLGSCHSLTKVQGKIIGDSMDIKMFEATGWNFEENEQGYDDMVLAVVTPPETSNSPPMPDSFEELQSSLLKSTMNRSCYSPLKQNNENSLPKKLGIIKRFEFTSNLQRMSVIVKDLKADKFRLYVKGSPEKLRELCKPISIPEGFHDKLDDYAKKGFRILACGTKSLDITFQSLEKLKREEIENDLVFIGFLIMENRVKGATPGSISKLHKAEIRTVMVTGDNILTAISVAKQCGLIPSEHLVFYGEIDSKKNIIWKDFHNNDNKILLNQNNFDSPSIIRSSRFSTKGDDKEMTLKPSDQNVFNLQSMESLTDSKRKELKGKKEKVNRNRHYSMIENNPIPWLKNSDEQFSLALTGEVFMRLIEEKNGPEKDVFDKMLEKARIFARMNPNEKTILIQELQKVKVGIFVGMCGDGVNDCGALKAADVGISLSEVEASIAAPFTSKIPDISCVLEVLKEGRCSLTTSLQCFKFMALYSMVQFTTVCLLHGAFSDLSNAEYMWIDLCIILPVAAFMSYTKAYEKLSKHRPISKLISFPVLASVLGQIIIQLWTQVGVYLLTVSRYPRCVELFDSIDDDENLYCYENTNVFLIANFQYLAVVLAFSIGPPFRKAFYSNYGFSISIFILYVCCFVMLFFPWFDLRDFVPLLSLDTNMKCYLAGIAIGNLLITFLYEKIVLDLLARIWYKYKEKN